MPEEPAPLPLTEQSTLDQAASASPGSFGRYRLLQRIGEGGMGEVWVAEQTEPVHRQVALKVIKAGMDSAQVVARFEAERQALALMDHPVIATVFDGGTTPQGRPYFAMEYVKGEPITLYCDRHRLSTAERLELFMQVCEGVQHAHQKGIIHRDLKPSNVLVTIQDDRPVPKIIDFGVAKATTQHLTERSLFTELGVLIGTPEYMSPEQAEMGGLDVDTRTDIYALGVLLYELLSGALPFDRKELRQAGLSEIQRIIREKEPPRPSTRITQLGPESTEAATNRHTEPRRLVSELRGDLDWITMRALEKDRTRRYQTANALAMDVRRHLNDEPVLAGPPDAAYLAGKFVRRHRFGVAAAVLLVALLGAFAGAMAVQARRIARERDKAERLATFMTDLFRVSDPSEARGNTITAREILDKGAEKISRELTDEPETRATLMDTMGWVYVGLGLYKQATPLLEEALHLRRQVLGNRHVDLAQNLQRLGWLKTASGDYRTAEALVREALGMRRSLLGDAHPDVAESMTVLADVLMVKGDYTAAEALARQAVAIQRALPQVRPAKLAYAIGELVAVLQAQDKYHEVEALAREALELYKNARDESRVSYSMTGLGIVLWHNGDYAGAEALFREALEIDRRILGPRHTRVGTDLGNISGVLWQQGKLAEAVALYQECVAIKRAALGPDSPELASDLTDLGNLLQQEGDLTAGEAALREALGIDRKVLGNEHRETARCLIILGEVLGKKGDKAAEESLLREGLAIQRRVLGEDHWEVGWSLANLADLLLDAGRAAEAEELARQGVRILGKALPPENADRAAGETILGRGLSKLGQFAEAEQLLLRGYEVLKAKEPQTHRTKLRLQWLIALYEAWGKPEKAREWRAKLQAAETATRSKK